MPYLAKINDYIWNIKHTHLTWWQRSMLLIVRLFLTTLKDLSSGQLSLRAMSLVYTTVISIVPLLAVCFSVLKGFGAHNQIGPALKNLLSPLGEKGHEISQRIIEFVDNIQVGVLGTLGLALLIYSVIAMMQKIERSFNYIWRIQNERSFSQRFSDYLSVLLVGPLLIFLSIGITTSLQTNVAVEFLSTIPFLGPIITAIGSVIPYFIMAGGFAFIYSYMPNTKVRLISAFWGGLATAIAWKLMGIIFATFVANSSSHTAIYSAFAAIIVLMVWIYMAWLVILIGGTLCFYHQNPRQMRIPRQNLSLSPQNKETLGLSIMYLAGKHFYEQKPALTLADILNYTHLPENIINHEIENLKNTGFLISEQDHAHGLYPSKPLEHITLDDILHTIRNDGSFKHQKTLHTPKVISDYIATSNELRATEQKKQTLLSLVQHTL